MPTYEYVCRACRHEFERFQPITSSPVRTCPKCGRKRVERKIGIGAAVLFKGGGFYETDYRSESYRKTEEAEKKETEKASEKASEKKSADSAKPTDNKVVPAPKETAKPAEKAAAASTISESKSQASSQASSQAPSPASRETPANPREKQEKKSAREGRGVGNLKQPAKTPSRASKPARKTKK